MVQVSVTRVSIPAYSSLGFGYGTCADCGTEVRFVGDHRPMLDLGEAVSAGGDEPPVAEVEEYQIVNRASHVVAHGEVN